MSTGTDKKVFGKYAGVVFANDDPKKLGRIRATVPELGFTESPTDWAFPCVPPGHLSVPPLGSNVWLEFEAGNIDRPIWVGVFYSEPAGQSEVPGAARGVTDDTLGKGTDQLVTGDGLTGNEPPDPHASRYPTARIIQTPSGHTIEIDDTPGQERLAIFHRIGSYLEAKRDGSITEKSIGRWHQIVGGNKIEHVVGEKIVVIESAVNETVRGIMRRHQDGELQETFGRKVTREYGDSVLDKYKGDAVMEIAGTLKQHAQGSIEQSAAGSLNQTVGGQHAKFVIGSSTEQVGNLLLSPVAKDTSVLLGNVLRTIQGAGIMADTIIGAGNLMRTATVGSIVDTASVSYNVSAGISAIISSLLVQLGGPTAIEPLVKGLAFMSLFNAHGHSSYVTKAEFDSHSHLYSPGPGSPTPSGPPAVPASGVPTALNTTPTPIVAGVHTSLTVFTK